MAEGYLDFTAGSGLPAASLEDYCEAQSIMRFANAAARDAALSIIKTEGMLAYLKDVNTITVYTGTLWSTIGPVLGALPSWTTAVTQLGAVTHSVNLANYSKVGRMVTAEFYLVMTGAGTGANLITINLPVTADAAWVGDNLTLGGYFFEDVSAVSVQFGQICLKTTTTMQLRVNSTGAPTFQGTAGITAALASGDFISGFIIYAAGADT